MKKYNILPIALFLLLSFCHVSFAQDWPNLKRYQQANAALKPPASNQKRVLFMGDSITDIWIQHSPDFFANHPYLDRGISGQTTPQMLIRFQQDVIQLHPKVVVILAGTNDIAGNTGPSTLGMIEDNLTSMSELAEANGIKVILCSVLPAYKYSWSPKVKPAQKIVDLNTWIQHYAEGNGYTYCNYYPALTNQKGGMMAKYSKDGVHPNTAGFSIMEPIVVKSIHETLRN